MDEPKQSVLNFGAFTVNVAGAEIRRDGKAVDVEPQVFDLVVLLCTNPGRVIGHEQIIEQVWHGRVVSDSAIASRINAARKALGDDGKSQRIIKTVRGRGFRVELQQVEASASTRADRTVREYGAEEVFVLSCTPHGYSLLMSTRSEDPAQDWRAGLPFIVADAASRHEGSVPAPHLAVFSDATRAASCARTILEEIETRCGSLPPAETWTVKIGIASGTGGAESAIALAGRLDAAAPPRGICMTEDVWTKVVNRLDMDAEAVPEGTIPGQGRVFRVTRIGESALLTADIASVPQILNLTMPEPAGVSIVVLPFEIVRDRTELEDVAIGVRLEIQNALTQLSGVLPIAAGTAMACAGATSPRAAEALGVRYVLQGNLRAIGRKMRMMVELYDHRAKGVTWSHSYEGSLDKGFELQDELAGRIVTALDVKVLSGEQARVWRKSLTDYRAIQLQYAGMRDFFRMTKECMRSARDAFERLHELCPDVSIGATWITMCHWFELQRGWSEEPEKTKKAIKRWANIATKMEDADGQAHTALCHVHLLDREYDEALKIGERAVSIRPSCANANGFYSHALYYCGVLNKAVYHARLAIRFAPAYPPLFAVVLSGALHASGDQGAAIPVAKEVLRMVPRDVHPRVILCSALIDASRRAEARSLAAELLQLDSGFDAGEFLDRLPFRQEQMREQLATNFARALEIAA